jgi:CBS-domain-containing membrane protein
MLGFERVHDYVPGKSDWLARGLPTEGTAAKRQRVGALALDDVVTCRVDDPIGEVRSRIEESRYGFALVTTERGTLLGRLRTRAMDRADAVAVAESLMEPGPSTVRPDVEASKLAARLADGGLRTAIVTSPDGRLLGVVRREDLES